MSRKHQLRTDRANKSPIINATSKGQETEVIQALYKVVDHLGAKFDKKISLVHEKQWHLKDIVAELKHSFADVEFHYHFDSSSIPCFCHHLRKG